MVWSHAGAGPCWQRASVPLVIFQPIVFDNNIDMARLRIVMTQALFSPFPFLLVFTRRFGGILELHLDRLHPLDSVGKCEALHLLEVVFDRVVLWWGGMSSLLVVSHTRPRSATRRASRLPIVHHT